MCECPEKLKYAITHEWVKQEDQHIISIGITDFAQNELGDIVYVNLPTIGKVFTQEEQCVTIESVKTASDLFSPVAGEVIEINEVLTDQPELINEAPYDAWIFKLKIENASHLEHLLEASAYKEVTE